MGKHMISNEKIEYEWPLSMNSDAFHVWKGRYLNTVFLFELGNRGFLITIDKGKVTVNRKQDYVMPQWQLAFRATEEVWEKFFKSVPPPEYHDLLAMMKFGKLKIEGDLYCFISHLLWFKTLFAGLRHKEQ